LTPTWAAEGVGAGATRLAKTRITLRGSDLPLGSVLSQVARSAQLALVVDRDVRLDRLIASPNLEDQALDTALAVVLTPLGYSFEVDEPRGHLRIFVYETRTFKVAMPVVSQNWGASISNNDLRAGQPSGNVDNGATVGLSARSDTAGVWDEVEKSLVRLLGDPAAPPPSANPTDKEAAAKPRDLGAFSVNRVAGFVTVRALPTVMHTIQSYFDALNEEMGRSVSIEARVMEVDINTMTEAGLDWNLLAARLGDIVFLAGNMGKSSLLTSTGIPFLSVSGRAGDAFIRAMEEQGKVTVMAQPTLVLGNNLPAIIELAQVQAYVAQQKVTTTGYATETTVQTASLSDGLIISMLPRVLEDGEVSLALATVLQDVLAVNRENFRDGFVDLPKTSRRSYNGVVRCKLNETIVIGGLLSSRKEHQHTGIPFLSRIPVVGWLFGGMKNVDRRSELVIAVTPREIKGMPALTPQPMENVNLAGETK
jgi:type II secretory pathway component GspD/PulD (secretin)